jgi:arabinogalactan oligomer/maltooligosaccharide transport system permease protein
MVGGGSMRTSIEIAKIALTMLALFIVAVLLYPVILIVAQAIVGNTAVIVSSFDYLARYGITIDNFKAIIRDPLFLESLKNTLIVGILTIVFAIVFIIPSAYAFSRFSFRGRDTILYIYLIVSQAGGGLGLIAILALYIQCTLMVLRILLGIGRTQGS